jgi:hypothetical protein
VAVTAPALRASGVLAAVDAPACWRGMPAT